jgi:hypothetical protein
VQDVKGSITGIAKKILKKNFPRNWHSLYHVSKNCQKSKIIPILCVHHPRVASNRFGEMCMIFFMAPVFIWGTSRDFGHYMAYG